MKALRLAFALTFALDVSVTQTPQGVVSDGEDRVWKYSGNADYYLALDSDRRGLWPGGLLKVTGRTKFGRGVLIQYIDSGRVDVDHSVVVTMRPQMYF